MTVEPRRGLAVVVATVALLGALLVSVPAGAQEAPTTTSSTTTSTTVPPDPAALAAEAADALVLPDPELATNPAPEAQHLVTLATWFWIDPASWRPRCPGPARAR